MKKVILAVAAVMMTASVSFAVSLDGANQHSIVPSRHNIPTGGTSNGAFITTGANYQQICIYCHAPHNPVQNTPLWNRNASSTTYTYYNSPTLTSISKNPSTVTSSTVSGMCLSCHDGQTSIGAIKNKADTGIQAGIVIFNTGAGFSDVGNANGLIGTDLANDHPISFNYDDAYNALDPDQVDKATANSRLWDSATVKKTLGNFLFAADAMSAGGDGTQMECASCHRVHDPFNAPFLRVTNNMSHLCLACHNK
jgi:predicted CXXCH cytochrome family protein